MKKGRHRTVFCNRNFPPESGYPILGRERKKMKLIADAKWNIFFERKIEIGKSKENPRGTLPEYPVRSFLLAVLV